MPYTPFGRFGQPFKSPDTMDFRNIRGGVITSKEIVIAGGTQGVIRSQNYDPDNNLGFAVFGDGSAVLNDVEVRGAIIAGTGSDVDWSHISNVSVGTADIENAAITNAKVNDLSADKLTAGTIDASVITVTNLDADQLTAGIITGLRYRTAASGERLEVRGDTGEGFIRMYNSSGVEVGRMGYDPTGFGTTDLGISNSSSIGGITLDAEGGIDLTATGSAGLGVFVTNPAPAGGIPGKPFVVNDGTGAGFQVYDSNSTATPTWSFTADTDTGIVWVKANEWGAVAGGTLFFHLDSVDKQVLFRNGSSTRPVIANSGRTAGLWWPDDFSVAISTGASTVVKFHDSQVQLNNGSAAHAALGFISQEDTGIYRSSTSVVGISSAGSEAARFALNNVWLTGAKGNTSGSTGTAGIIATDGKIYRSTSAAKYKSRITKNVDYLADIKLEPTKHYRKDDKKWRYGFIADWLAEQDKLLGEYDEGELEHFDMGAVLAVMAAKINRLEAEMAALQN